MSPNPGAKNVPKISVGIKPNLITYCQNTECAYINAYIGQHYPACTNRKCSKHRQFKCTEKGCSLQHYCMPKIKYEKNTPNKITTRIKPHKLCAQTKALVCKLRNHLKIEIMREKYCLFK